MNLELELARERYKNNVEFIEALGPIALENLIINDCCPFQPENLKDIEFTMLACPYCKEYVVAGLPHPGCYTGEWDKKLEQLSALPYSSIS